MTPQRPRSTIELHWAINQTRPSRHEPTIRSARGEIVHPFGAVVTWDRHHADVRCLVPEHTFVVSNACRIERDNWHNRIHYAAARYIATRHDGSEVLEYGMTACGRHLVNPLYVDVAERRCCHDLDASRCPGCWLVVHREVVAP